MRKCLFTLIILLLVCTLVAQSQTKGRASTRKGAAAKKKATARSKQQIETTSAPRRLWFTLSLTGAFDSNIEDDEQGLSSFGIVPSVDVHFQDNPEKPSFETHYEVAFHRYTNSDKYDRVSQNLTASHRLQLSRRWQLRTTGEMSLKGSSEDRDINN